MRVLDLFSGIGGFSLGLERAGMQTVAFCEIDPFCQKVLKKHWPNVPIFNDIRTLDYDGKVDLVCGGFPCQPFSSAGKRKGKEDNRDLWPEMFRIVQRYKPTWVIGENVAGFVNMELERTATDLESEGYEVQAFLIPACAVGAPHQRNRIWIVAHADSKWQLQPEEPIGKKRRWVGNSGNAASNVADASGTGLAQSEQEVLRRARRRQEGRAATERGWWVVEPAVGRVVNGLPGELDFIGGLEDEQRSSAKSQPEIDVIIWKMLRAMWEYQDIAAASPQLYADRIYNCMPEMSPEDSHRRWLMGSGIKKDKGLCSLWESFYTKSFEEAQNMQQKLLKQIRAYERKQKMASRRMDRIKALGNALVPQIPEIIGRYIMEQKQ